MTVPNYEDCKVSFVGLAVCFAPAVLFTGALGFLLYLVWFYR